MEITTISQKFLKKFPVAWLLFNLKSDPQSIEDGD